VKSAKRKRPKLPPISEQMKAWSAALVIKAADWPEVGSRSFFGFNALYRKDKMFAILPRTRGMEAPNALASRMDSPTTKDRVRLEGDPRIRSAEIKKARWFSFELASDADLHDALDWLGRAYEVFGQV
jgi:hypothetical protein